MTEIMFHVERDPDGGYTARAVGASIFTEAETLQELKANVREAVRCHFAGVCRQRSKTRIQFVGENL